MCKGFRIPIVALLLMACGGPQSMFETAGPDAARVIVLWWILFAICLFVTIAVIGVLLVASFRRRSEGELPVPDKKLGVAMGWGIGVTIVLLTVILTATFRSSDAYAEQGPVALTIDVVGKLWWWEVTYLGENGEPLFRTANEIHIPTGVPVRFRLRSDNVIHSFWVPSLAGKVDLLPGRTNYLRLAANKAGIYRGQCAEYCGIQHALMAFLVIAQLPEEFAEWMEAQQLPAREPKDEMTHRGKNVFLQAGCAKCHTVRGVAVAVEAGPDLTHLAPRHTLAAASLPNRRGHLGGWISDPQGIKPGNLMPATPLNSEDFQALLRYLENLQ